MADDKTTKTPEQPVTDSGPGKETPPAPPKEPEKVSVSPEPEKKTEPEVKNPQVSVYNFAEIMKEKKVEERAAAPSGEKPAPAKTEKPEKSKQETAAKAAALSFSPETDLGWPLQGDVILNYSMDQTIYFSTLEQYKYNPAVIIAGKVNDPVNAAATGKITDISTNEETGVTVTMELGDGYSAVYGQLKEVLYKEGATVEAGNAIGYIAEPTKYYSVEGSNLYFELQKDGEPVNPMQYME